MEDLNNKEHKKVVLAYLQAARLKNTGKQIEEDSGKELQIELGQSEAKSQKDASTDT